MKLKMVALGLNVKQATMLIKNIWNLLDTYKEMIIMAKCGNKKKGTKKGGKKPC